MKITILSILIAALAGCASQTKESVPVTAVIQYVQPQNDTLVRNLAPFTAKIRVLPGQDSGREQTWSAVAAKCDASAACKQTLIKVTVQIDRVDVDGAGVNVQGKFVSAMGRKVEFYSGDKRSSSMSSTEEITGPGPVLSEGVVSTPFKQHLRFDEDLSIDGPFGSKAIITISKKRIEEMAD